MRAGAVCLDPRWPTTYTKLHGQYTTTYLLTQHHFSTQCFGATATIPGPRVLPPESATWPYLHTKLH